ncbi:hypothetical protein KF840_24990 [bacterium]|nr:hypothetical protein [bacterium]
MPRWLPLAILLCALPATAQIRTPGASAVSEHSGPIGADSGPVGAGSRSMYEGITIGESSGRHPDDRRTGGPVRDRGTRSMRSGPVSSISSGPMTQPRTLPDGGSMTQHSAGAVKHDITQPLGSRISQPLRELAPLQAHLRELREHGSDAAVAAAQAPAVADPAPALEPEWLAGAGADDVDEPAADAPPEHEGPAGNEETAPLPRPANPR